MFGFLKGVTKAVVRTATLPVAAVVDVVTVGGILVDSDTDSPFPATGKTLSKIGDDLREAIDSDD